MFRDMLRALLQTPVTEQYPAERHAAPGTLRARLHWNQQGCTGCNLCVKDCPAEALKLITIDKAAKRFVMEHHTDRCIYCAQCIEACRFGCYHMEHDEWELATTSRDGCTIYFGNKEDVDLVLARQPAPDAESGE